MSNWSKFLEHFKVDDEEVTTMKIKVHKIRGIDMAVCTAEQKIAYNLAFANYYDYRDTFLGLPTEMAKSEAVTELRDNWLRLYRMSCNYTGKYNEDAIAVALNQGIRSYMEKPFIASDYSQIGDCFKLPYNI